MKPVKLRKSTLEEMIKAFSKHIEINQAHHMSNNCWKNQQYLYNMVLNRRYLAAIIENDCVLFDSGNDAVYLDFAGYYILDIHNNFGEIVSR